MAAHDDGLVFEDDDAPPPRRRSDDPDALPRRKKKKPKSLRGTLLKPALGVGAALALLGVFGGLTYWVATSLTGGPPLVPAELWQEQVLADRFKVLLPGSATCDYTDRDGSISTTFTVSPRKDPFYSATFTDGKLSPARAALTTDELLDDSCQGSFNVAKAHDADLKELSRTEVVFEGHRGKQIVMQVSYGNAQIVLRVYSVEGRLFILYCAGRGVTADNANVKYLFDSFKSVPEGERKTKPKAEVAAAPVAPPAVTSPTVVPVPPAVTPPPLPPPVPLKPAADPTLPKLAAKFTVSPAGLFAGVLSMAFSPDGKTLTLGTSAGRAAWYDADTGKVLADVGRGVGGLDEEMGAAVSPRGDRVAFGRHGGRFHYWERGEKAEKLLTARDTHGYVNQLRAAFSPDGATLCTTEIGDVAHVWDLASGRDKVLGTSSYANKIRSAAYSPDGELLALAESKVVVRDAKTLRLIGTLEAQGPSEFTELRFAPDNATLVGVAGKSLAVWDFARDREAETVVWTVRVVEGVETVNGVAFSPDGKWLVGLTESGQVRVWDAQTWKQRGDLNFLTHGTPTALAFRAGDARLAVACGPSILLLDLDAQKWDSPPR